MKKIIHFQIMIILFFSITTSFTQITRYSLELFPSFNFDLSGDNIGMGMGAGVNVKWSDWLYSASAQIGASPGISTSGPDFAIRTFTLFAGKRYEMKASHFDVQLGLGYQDGYSENGNYSYNHNEYHKRLRSPHLSGKIGFRVSRATKYLGFGMGLQLNVGLDNVNFVLPFILEIGKLR